MSVEQNEQLLQVILSDPRFAHFAATDNGEDYRDPTSKNPSLSLSVSGWYDHKTSKGGSLHDFAVDHQIKLPRNFASPKPKIQPEAIYRNATLTPVDVFAIQQYFKQRGLQLTREYIENAQLKVSRYDSADGKQTEIVAPMVDVDGEILQIYRITIDEAGGTFAKVRKSLLGRANRSRAVFLGNAASDTAYGFEGLEDAIAWDLATGGEACLLVAGPAVNWKLLDGFVENYDSFTLVLDPDTEQVSAYHSKPLGGRVHRLLPADDRDCNKAVQDEDFDAWFDGLTDMEYSAIERLKPPTGNKSAQKPKRSRLELSQLLPGGIPPLNDLGNAERLITAYDGDMRYAADIDAWLLWKEGRWVEDKSLLHQEYAKKAMLAIDKEIESVDDVELRLLLASHANASQSKKFVANALSLARSDPRVSITSEEFDEKSYLLNFSNGTYDLQTNEFRKPNREDKLTKQLEVAYDPGARCPQWQSFVDQISCGSPGLAAYLKRAIGYSISGATHEEVMFFMFGGGKNGKSTLIGVIEEIFSPYASKISADRLCVNKMSGAAVPNDLAQLRGARVAISSEIKDESVLDQAKIKDMTGRDKIQARFLYGNLFEYMPQFKLWLYGNHKPKINDGGVGIWRRIQLIPFNYTVDEAQMNLTLREDMLEQEAAGIVNWCIEGYNEWVAQGLEPCAEVRDATQEYKDTSDILGQFLDVHVEVVDATPKTNPVLLTDLYAQYAVWAEELGLPLLSKPKFTSRIGDLGFNAVRSTAKAKSPLYRKSIVKKLAWKEGAQPGDAPPY